MSTVVESVTDIPRAPWYVSMTDTALSGWGLAEGLVNRHVVVCQSYTDAELVAERARAMPEMRRVSVSSRRPRLRAGWLVTVTVDPSAWIARALADRRIVA